MLYYKLKKPKHSVHYDLPTLSQYVQAVYTITAICDQIQTDKYNWYIYNQNPNSLYLRSTRLILIASLGIMNPTLASFLMCMLSLKQYF